MVTAKTRMMWECQSCGEKIPYIPNERVTCTWCGRIIQLPKVSELGLDMRAEWFSSQAKNLRDHKKEMERRKKCIEKFEEKARKERLSKERKMVQKMRKEQRKEEELQKQLITHQPGCGTEEFITQGDAGCALAIAGIVIFLPLSILLMCCSNGTDLLFFIVVMIFTLLALGCVVTPTTQDKPTRIDQENAQYTNLLKIKEMDEKQNQHLR